MRICSRSLDNGYSSHIHRQSATGLWRSTSSIAQSIISNRLQPQN